MEATLRVLNTLVQDGVIPKYAIGGAVGAIFWVEPFDTIDLDVFVLLPAGAHPLDPLAGVFSRLRALGYAFEGEFAWIEGVPVQFLPADDETGLARAALEAAAEYRYLGTVPTFVMRPEHLVALALATHRPKDYERVFRLLSEAAVDRGTLAALVRDHGLLPFWTIFLRRYPELA